MSLAEPIMLDHAAAGVFGTRGPVPLEGVAVEGRLRGACLQTELRQRFRNVEEVPVEAVYVFPLPAEAALCHFEVRTDDGTVLGQVEEREEAFDRYDQAMADGHRAFLMDQERPNVFTTSVGNLQPGAAVELVLRWVMLAPWQDGALRVTVPTTVSPRYVPERRDEPGQPDGERVNPEPWLDVPYGFSFRLDVDAGSPLKSLRSPTHPIDVGLGEEGRAVVSLGTPLAAMDRDLVVVVEPAAGAAPMVRSATGPDGATYTMVTVLPEQDPEHQAADVVFLLDCSGSMMGSSIHQARRALGLALRALEAGDRFEIIRFGSTFETLWDRLRDYDDATLDDSLAFLADVDADLGGTEMLAALRHAVTGHESRERRLELVLITDGQVSDEDRMLDLLREGGDGVRCFTLGIGHGPNEHLLHEAARISGAACEMVGPEERIEPMVLRTLGRLRQAPVGEVRLPSASATQAPARPAAFAGEPVTVLARFDNEPPKTLTVDIGGEERAVEAGEAEAGGPVPTLWARHRIRDLESDSGRHGSAQRRPHRRSRAEAEIVELGCRFGLTTSRTSWVVVQEMEGDERVTEAAQLRKVPVALTEGWGGVGAAPPMPCASLALRESAELRMSTVAPASKSSRAAHESSLVDSNTAFDLEPMEMEGISDFDDEEVLEEELEPSFDTDSLYDLLAAQSADGHFEIPDDAHLPDDPSELRQRLGRTVADTLMVLHLLESAFPARADEWQAAAKKARRWLQRQGAPASLEAARAAAGGD